MVRESAPVKPVGENEAPARLDEAETALEAGRYEDVVRTTELLAAWHDRKSPEYARTLHLRARALDQLGEKQKVIGIATDYLTAFPRGAERGWFLVYLANEKYQAGRWRDAAVIWNQALKEDVSISSADSIKGAEVFLQTGEAAAAREILEKTRHNPADGSLTAQREELLLESLLIEDNLAVAVPEKRFDPAFNFRRALLLESRNLRTEALAEYNALAMQEDTLAPDEKEILQRRIASRNPWKER